MRETSERRPRVLFVVASAVVGGAETQTAHLLRHLRRVEPVLMIRAATRDHFQPLGLPTYVADDFGCGEILHRSPGNVWKYLRAIRAVARAERPRVLVGIMETASFHVTFANELFRLGAAAVSTIRGPMSTFFAFRRRRPSPGERFLLWYVFRRSRLVVVPSRGVRDDLVEHLGARDDRVIVILNGVDVDRIRALARAPRPVALPKNCPWLVTACRLSPEKDFATLLDAFRLLRATRRATLIIVGDGPMRAEILTRVEHHGLDGDVVLTGFLPNPFPVLAAADVVLSTSRFEGFGNTLAEALALGRPVVATDAPVGSRELLEGGRCGRLVAVGDAGAVARACRDILDEPAAGARLSEAALERAETLSITRTAAAWDETLAALARR